VNSLGPVFRRYDGQAQDSGGLCHGDLSKLYLQGGSRHDGPDGSAAFGKDFQGGGLLSSIIGMFGGSETGMGTNTTFAGGQSAGYFNAWSSTPAARSTVLAPPA
jgi:hypothetical protein